MESEQQEQRQRQWQRQKSTNKKPIESEWQMAKRTLKSISQIYTRHTKGLTIIVATQQWVGLGQGKVWELGRWHKGNAKKASAAFKHSQTIAKQIRAGLAVNRHFGSIENMADKLTTVTREKKTNNTLTLLIVQE